MAKRSLSSLQKQYARKVVEGRGPRGPRGPRGVPGGGKPKHTKKTVARIAHYVSAYKGRLFLVVFLMLANTVASLLASYLLAPIINRIQLAVDPAAVIEWTPIGKAVNGVIEAFASSPLIQSMMGTVYETVTVYVMAAVCVIGLVYFIQVVSSYLQSRIMLQVSHDASEAIRGDLFRKLQTLPVRFFDNNTTGDVMSRFTNDVDNIDMMLNQSLVGLVSGVISLVGTFVFMVTTNIWLTLVTLVFVPVFLFGGGWIGKKSGRYYGGQQASLGAVNGYIEESVTGQKVVKVFNHEETAVEEFSLLNQDLREKQLKAQFYGGIMGPIMNNLSHISYAVTVGVGGVLMATTGLGAGDLTVFATYSRQFSMPINHISQQMSTVFAALAGAERVFAVMDAEPEAPNAENACQTGIVGDVELRNVSFGYVPEKRILKNISLYAHPGQKIAFVGSTGAGKTTVTNLLNRFYDIDEGQILIDGRDIKDYDRSYLRRSVTMVLQDTHLFTGSVRENIRYGRLDATDEEVEAAARTASAHSFIMRLENGYDTMIEGDGQNLSQGQRQLLNIARAAVSHAPILVLDEATSSVDTRTERHIEHGMDRLMKTRTTFVIAHRLSTVRNSNCIMVLEKGEIIERGTHEELIALRGRYYELYTGKRELD